MFRTFLVVSALLAGSANAQEANDLSLGQTVGETPVGAQYDKSTHGDWSVRCVKAPEGKTDRCTIYQLLREENGNPIAEVSMFNLPNPGAAVAGATIVTPLETLLQPQLQIKIDDGDAKIYPYSFRNKTGCFACVGFTALELASLERGNAAIVTIFAVAKPKEPINITMSLNGFTSAYDALFE